MKRKVFFSPLLLSVALSPAFFQISYSCERGNTFLLSLEVEVSGQDQIVGFSTTNRDYAITIESSTATVSVVTQDPASVATYRWFVDGTAIGPALAIGVGGGQVTVNVPDGQSELYVNVQAPEGAFDSYVVNVDGPGAGPPCTGTPGSGLPDDPDLCTKPITVAMSWNVTPGFFVLLPYTLEVLPTSQINANQLFTADLSGAVEFPEFLLDAFQAVIPGGVDGAIVEDLKATVQTRGGGATGADVALGIDESALVPGPTRFCTIPPDQTCTADGDCLVPPCLPPVNIVGFPTSADCAPGGVCETLDDPGCTFCAKSNQCTANGFCIIGNALLPLAPVLGASYMAGDGVTQGQTAALFGWADFPPPVNAVGVPPLDPDGTWNIISPSYASATGELGIRLNLGGLFVAFEGVMAVDSNGPDGVGVPGDASPTPDSALISFPVPTVPTVPCSGTPGSGLPEDPDFCMKDITVAWVTNVPASVNISPYLLEVRPTSPIIANQSFRADVSGVAQIAEIYIDFLQAVSPGGVTQIQLVDLVATVQTRGGGATGADVALGGGASVPFECALFDTGPGAQVTCDPLNDVAGIPGFRGNTDCVPVGTFNPCTRIVEIPISTDCAPGGVCETLDDPGCTICRKSDQCALNGFCATGPLLLPLAPVLGASYMAGDGVTPGQTEALFGWADNPPPATAVGVPAIDGDGTWNMLNMPPSGYTGIAGEIGIAFVADGLLIQIESVMAVDSHGPDGVGVPDDASPTPDSALISFPVSPDNCTGVPCDDANDCTQNVCTSVGGPTCSNPAEPAGTSCNGGAGACDGAGSCVDN